MYLRLLYVLQYFFNILKVNIVYLYKFTLWQMNFQPSEKLKISEARLGFIDNDIAP